MPVLSLNKRSVLMSGAALAVALMAASCGPQYEIDRPGTWRPTGANDFNLRAMIADKNDLKSGASATTERGNVAAQAVTRLYTDHRRALQDVSLTKVGPSSGGSDSGSGGGGSGGGSGGGAPQ